MDIDETFTFPRYPNSEFRIDELLILMYHWCLGAVSLATAVNTGTSSEFAVSLTFGSCVMTFDRGDYSCKFRIDERLILIVMYEFHWCLGVVTLPPTSSGWLGKSSLARETSSQLAVAVPCGWRCFTSTGTRPRPRRYFSCCTESCSTRSYLIEHVLTGGCKS